MTGTKHFGDVQWDSGKEMLGWNPGRGWRMPSDRGSYITVDDPYWGHVLDNARKSYGDPGIHFDTDDQGQVRHLVFGDGSALPADGTIVYHDAARHQNWAQNDDGTASLIGPDGKPGPALAPAGYHKFGDQYAPVNATGQQIGPQQGGLPPSSGGFFTDPKTGVLTPKNANGDYYTLGPDGKKAFFDRTGAPITEQQYNDSTASRTPGASPDTAGLPTGEQQSGKAADAVRKLQDELKERYTTISSAEEKLSEVLLNAKATTADGQSKLNDIQQKIVEAVNNPAMETTTAAGEKAYLTLLRSQVSAIKDLLASSSLSAEDQSKAAQALAALYAADNGGTTGPSDPSTDTAPPAAAPPAAAADPGAAVDPSLTDPSLTDPGLGPAPQMPDPSLSDVLGGGPLGPMGSDPMSSLASMLPGAMSGLGGLGAGGNPLDALSGLAGAASPLAGLASGLGDQGGRDHASDSTDKVDDTTDAAKNGKDNPDPGKKDTTTPPDQQQTSNSQQPGQPDPQATTLAGQPPAAAAPPAPPSPTVKLPDGSIANARTPAAAQAVRDYLAGGTVEAAYKQNGMTLPPVGTPVTAPVDPTRLNCGDVAMFKDHYEPLLSSVKGYLNGQVVPLSQVTSSPDFLGFIDPTAASASASPTPAAAAAPVPAPAPAAVPAAPPGAVTQPTPADVAPLPTG